MFSSQLRQKLSQSRAQIYQTTQRRFQTFGKEYLSGFDKTLKDKLQWLMVGGNWFLLFGVGNALAYGASLVMTEEQYLYHFSYKGDVPRMFSPIKAMLGSNTLANAIWTAPSLIALHFYLLPKVGPLALTKLFGLSIASTFIFWSAFNPQSGLNVRPLRNYIFKFDSNGNHGEYYMGADQLAQSIIYFALMYNRLWYIALPFMTFDALYYGPQTFGGLISAFAGFCMFA
ncbi:UNKNOWN [Stylonychia lemnae]|uniref:Uncharacterized protein n=1 Tax=Stylonychia lemnae TaxID=5949 RepID=A0A078AKB3_STYLE|nr:UNKNOWN [Stylonychia lemnae]|eukprot:CDW82825.1 UNKNOWN [Stylonychia lemnae]